MRIYSCEVLEVGQRAQTLTCLILAQWPQLSGWSLPHSDSAPQSSTSLPGDPALSPQSKAWIPRGFKSLNGHPLFTRYPVHSTDHSRAQRTAKEEPEKPSFDGGLSGLAPGPIASGPPKVCFQETC